MPTGKAPTSPGPCVTPMASTSCNRIPACASASRTTGTICRRCSREASSGTTPPYLRCTSICDATMLDRISRPSATTAAAVSSQEDSIPNMRVLMWSLQRTAFGRPSLQLQTLQILAKVTAKFLVLQSDFYGRFQKPQFVACIVRNTIINVCPQTVFLGQNAQRVGQLDFVSCAGLGARQAIKNLRRQDVTPGDREIRWGFLRPRLFHHVADAQ